MKTTKINVCVGKYSHKGNNTFQEVKGVVELEGFFPKSKRKFFVKRSDYKKLEQIFSGERTIVEFAKYHNMIQEANKRGENAKFIDLYFESSEICKFTGSTIIRHIKDCRSNPSGKRFVYHFELIDAMDKAVSRETKARNKEENMKIIRFLHNGADDEPLYCPVETDRINSQLVNYGVTNKIKFNLESCDYTFGSGKSVNVFDLHHIKVENGSSVFKKNNSGDKETDPAKLLENGLLTKNKKHLIEMMGCIALSKTAHAAIHSEFKDSNISMFKAEWLPFVLQNETNFNAVCERFNLQLDYNVFISSLK